MKVFLSSTASDLEAYRKVADDTILRLLNESVLMERFGPLPGEPVDECERKARESDVVVCVVAHRYGFVPDKGKGSITRREVEAAEAAGRDVLVWIVDDEHPWTETKEQDLLTDRSVLSNGERVAEVTDNVSALVDFKDWLRRRFTVESFTTTDDLGRKIALALSSHARERSKIDSTRAGRAAAPNFRKVAEAAQRQAQQCETQARVHKRWLDFLRYAQWVYTIVGIASLLHGVYLLRTGVTEPAVAEIFLATFICAAHVFLGCSAYQSRCRVVLGGYRDLRDSYLAIAAKSAADRSTAFEKLEERRGNLQRDDLRGPPGPFYWWDRRFGRASAHHTAAAPASAAATAGPHAPGSRSEEHPPAV